MRARVHAAGVARRPKLRARAHSIWDSDIAWSFRRSPVAIASALVLGICLAAALFAPWVAPHNPFDLRTLNLLDALTPPAWEEGGKSGFALGTDDQSLAGPLLEWMSGLFGERG